jgi:hypothetical protein
MTQFNWLHFSIQVWIKIKYKKLYLHDICSGGNKQMNLSDELDEIGRKSMHGRVERNVENLLNLAFSI